VKDCNILTARNGREGSKDGFPPVACILTDFEMPVMDGYGVVNHRNKVCPHAPLLVSGRCVPEVVKKLGEMGVSELIEKPFYFEQLRNKIALALSDESIDTTKSNHLQQTACCTRKRTTAGTVISEKTVHAGTLFKNEADFL
jgi:response regulator RpfG family c-di-GMP phosphodiesterase